MAVLVVVGAFSFPEVSRAVRTVFPVKNYATVEIGRVSKKAYSSLPAKAQTVANIQLNLKL